MDDRDDNKVLALQRKLNDMSGHADTAHRAHVALDKAYKRIKELEAEVASLRGRFSSEFTGVAARKLEFLQNQGGRVVDVVMEDSVRGQAYLDRWGRVTWSDKPNNTLQGSPEAKRKELTLKAIVGTDGVPVIPDGWVQITGDEETKPGDKFYYPQSGNWVDYWFRLNGNHGTSLCTVKEFGWVSIRNANNAGRQP